MLDLAVRSRAAGHNDSILLFDRACDPSRGDLDPGALPVDFLPRRPGLDWRYPRRLRAWLGRTGARVVHAHNDSAVVYAAAAIRGMGRAAPRLVATWHNSPSHPTWGARLAARWASGRAHVNACVSSDLARWLEQRGWLRAPIVVRNGVDTGRFRPAEGGAREAAREKLGVVEDAFLVGMLSLVDALLSQPKDEIVTQMNLDNDISTALLENKGPLGRLLLLTQFLEQGDFDAVSELCEELELTAEDTFNAELEASSWVCELGESLN